MENFDKYMNKRQRYWRSVHISNQEAGKQNGVARDWILPASVDVKQVLWPGIRESLLEYLEGPPPIEMHKGSRNLKSSWVQCANTYFPFRNKGGLCLLAGFLREHVSPLIESVLAVELEYEEKDEVLKPPTLLGEPTAGHRGGNQTSPDLAFVVQTSKGMGLLLTENKLTEHSFYPCSGRKPEVQNPDIRRCLNWKAIYADIGTHCWQMNWENQTRTNRRYWDHIHLSKQGRNTFTRCPAASGGYQLLRQQALAEGIAEIGKKYDPVMSCVAYDSRNDTLIHCLRSTGIDNFAIGWGPLFDGKAKFATWTHQEWASWVKDHDRAGQWLDWLSYIDERYGFLEPCVTGD